MSKYLLYRRKTAIIFFDAMIFAAALSIWGFYSFNYHWSIGVVAALLLMLGTVYLFFSNKVFRYTFSIAFSIFYGVLLYAIGTHLDKQNPTAPAIVCGVSAFVISLWLHKDHFDFLKSANLIEYDKR